VGTFGISKDITQIKNAEIKLRQARRILQEANDAKDKFFSILAHDLKNPFNSLLGLSEILVEDFDKLANYEKLNMVKRIHGTSESAYALLENLLDWSRLQRGSMHLEPESTNLKQLVDDVIALSFLQAHNKNIALHTEIKDELRVFADPNMLKTIIRNLVSNAIKFTMPGGYVKISGHSDEWSTHIKVEDNGIGMSTEACKKLFSISEKNKTYGTNDESGTGLGLIICQEFAIKNKGDIEVSSHEGRGSTFTVILPKG
jgi:signal transduction histidine kinase